MKNTQINRRKFITLGSAAALSFTARGILPSLKPDILIIGAGATGCNAAWHLNKLGYKVTVLEASAGPAKQASQAAAGFVANWAGLHVPVWGANELKMQTYGIDFYTNLAERSKKDIGFKKVGICYIYTKDIDWQNAQSSIVNGRSLGIPFEIINKERSVNLLPIVKYDALAGIVYDPTAVRVRAADTIPFLAKEAKENGVEFIFDTRVESFIHSGAKVTGVKTSKGNLEAGNILITAGAWSLGLIAQEGKKPPVSPKIEVRYTTQSLPEVPSNLPLLIFDTGFYIREEFGGLLIGGGDDGTLPDRQVDINNVPTSDQLLHHPQIGRIEKHLSVIKDVMPVLSKTKIVQIKGGVPTFTKDAKFIAGRVGDTSNLYVITACQEAGITHGPALGKMISEFINSGESSMDIKKFNLDRF